MKTLGDRLRATREEQGLTQKGLAELSTTPQQVISKIETGATQESRHVIRLALALHVRPEWLAEGKGRKALDASTDENLGNTHAVTPRSRVPVISWVSAGNWSEAFDPYAPGNAARWEELTERVNTSRC